MAKEAGRILNCDLTFANHINGASLGDRTLYKQVCFHTSLALSYGRKGQKLFHRHAFKVKGVKMLPAITSTLSQLGDPGGHGDGHLLGSEDQVFASFPASPPRSQSGPTRFHRLPKATRAARTGPVSSSSSAHRKAPSSLHIHPVRCSAVLVPIWGRLHFGVFPEGNRRLKLPASEAA